MCLHINERIHPGQVARRASRNILVWKRLDLRFGKMQAPFRENFVWTPGRMEQSGLGHDWYGGVVEEGLHAHYLLTERVRSTTFTVVFPAIIPKGTVFFVDGKDEIVAEKMTVYRHWSPRRWFTREIGNIEDHPLDQDYMNLLRVHKATESA